MKKITMITKLIGYISYNKQIKIFVTSLFIFSFTYAKAQSVSYTEPSSYDLQLANKAVSSCRVLQDVISENSQVEDIPAIEAFIELQRTEDGNLLIDNEACRDSILEFVKSLCTSSSSKNNLYCESLGIQKSESTSDDSINNTNDYKKFGQSAIDNLGIDLSDDISFEPRLDEKDQSKLKFLAAGTLFHLSPVKKLRVASFFGRNVATRVKPVLSGALLVLATLGLSSCSDATGPEPVKPPPTVVETPCTRRESGYFQLSGANNECIKLPSLTYSFIASDDTESTISNGDPDTTIRIKFDSEVVFIDSSGQQALTPENALEMLEIKRANETDLTTSAGPINQDNISITTESSNTVITIKPPNSSNGKIYHVGEYSILTKNYAKKLDATKIQQSNSTYTYINDVKKESSFNVTVDNPCTRSENGYFYFRNADGTARCENLIPNVSYTFSKNNDPQAILNISFDSDIVYIDESGWSEIDDNNILEVLSINPTNASYTDDLLVEDGPIDQEQITVTKTNSKTTVTIEPPNGVLYQAGDYVISASNYIKRSSVDIVTRHNILRNYLETVKSNSNKGFSIDAVASLACGAETSQGYMTTIPIDDEHNQKQSFCGAYVHSHDQLGLDVGADTNCPRSKKADPNTTYVIDIGFVMSERYSTPGWDDFVRDDVLPHVNDIYQRSGVNVEFRAAAVVPFQDYRHYLPCQIDTLDLNNRDAESDARFNMVPVIRQFYGADLIYTIQNYAEEARICGAAGLRGQTKCLLDEAKRRAASGSVDPTCSSEEIPNISDRSQHYTFIGVLAHELGHNLGLLHNKEDYRTFPVTGIFHTTGYGYKGETSNINGMQVSYGTIMSAGISRVPFFSSDTTVSKEKLCLDENRYDNQLNGGFCAAVYDHLSDEQIRLGNEQANAVEALQYTIEDASKYHCSPGSC